MLGVYVTWILCVCNCIWDVCAGLHSFWPDAGCVQCYFWNECFVYAIFHLCTNCVLFVHWVLVYAFFDLSAGYMLYIIWVLCDLCAMLCSLQPEHWMYPYHIFDLSARCIIFDLRARCMLSITGVLGVHISLGVCYLWPLDVGYPWHECWVSDICCMSAGWMQSVILSAGCILILSRLLGVCYLEPKFRPCSICDPQCWVQSICDLSNQCMVSVTLVLSVCYLWPMFWMSAVCDMRAGCTITVTWVLGVCYLWPDCWVNGISDPKVPVMLSVIWVLVHDNWDLNAGWMLYCIH